MSGVKLNYHNEGSFEYFTVKNILPVNEYDNARFELEMFKKLFEPPHLTGTARRKGKELKNNSGVFMTNVLAPDHRHASSILTATMQTVQELLKYNIEKLRDKHSAFGALGNDVGYGVLLSGYKDGDYYDAHRDHSIATLIWWLVEPEEEYEGGELILTDFGVEIKPESYTGVIIPSWYRHEVRPISSGSSDYVRYAVSCFIQGPQ